MENFENQPPKTRVEEITNAILNSTKHIEEEFQKTANSWLECFGSRIFVIETLLYGKRSETELGAEKYNVAIKKLEALKEKHYDLKQQYPDKNTIPPDEIKQELLTMLNVLK